MVYRRSLAFFELHQTRGNSPTEKNNRTIYNLNRVFSSSSLALSAAPTFSRWIHPPQTYLNDVYNRSWAYSDGVMNLHTWALFFLIGCEFIVSVLSWISCLEIWSRMTCLGLTIFYSSTFLASKPLFFFHSFLFLIFPCFSCVLEQNKPEK